MVVKSIRKPAGGRPRLLTREQVVDAAVKLGLEDFTMKRVATELGVTTATLYQYVTDRDHLLRLAVTKEMASLSLPVDAGQHWSIFVRDYLKAVQTSLASNPHLLVRVLHSGFELETELPIAEYFLKFMARHDFSPQEAIYIFNLVGIAASGGALGLCRTRGREKKNGSLQRALQEAFTHYPLNELPLLRQVELEYSSNIDRLAIELIEPLIKQTALRRGENLPTSSDSH